MAQLLARRQIFTGQVGLVANDGEADVFWQPINKFRPDFPRVHRICRRAIHHEEHPVGLFDLGPGTLNADLLHLVLGVAQAGGVDDVQRHAIQVDMLAQHIAGGTGDLGDDGGLAPGQGIEQARLASVGTTGDHHLHPFPQQGALPGFAANLVQRPHDGVKIPRYLAVGEKIDLFIREVDGRFHIDAQADQALHQLLDFVGELPLQGVHGTAGGLLAGGFDEVGDGFGLGQIQLVIHEGALAELAGAGRAQPLDLQDAAHQHVHDDRAAVALQLQHVFAGEAVGGLEQQGDALIQHFALLIPERQIFGVTHSRAFAEYYLGHLFGGGTGDPDYADAATAGGGGLGHDRICSHLAWLVCSVIGGHCNKKGGPKAASFVITGRLAAHQLRECRPFFSS